MRNKTNVNYLKIDYCESREDHKVECDLTYEIKFDGWPINDFKINADTVLKVGKKLGMINYRVDKKTNYPTSLIFMTKAQASCDISTDEYDIATGEHIALTRAQAKAFEKTCVFYDMLQYEIEKTFNEMIRAIDNNYNAANKCWAHAKKLGNY